MRKGPLTERATSDLNSEWLRCPQLSCYPLYKPMQARMWIMTIKMQMTGTLTRVTRDSRGQVFPSMTPRQLRDVTCHIDSSLHWRPTNEI